MEVPARLAVDGGQRVDTETVVLGSPQEEEKEEGEEEEEEEEDVKPRRRLLTKYRPFPQKIASLLTNQLQSPQIPTFSQNNFHLILEICRLVTKHVTKHQVFALALA